ncbi:HBL251Cp [Eremothecium sinecaudum]|uniref:Calcium-channel protein CCH1 n=1 Tax=Eremothecium sinecaudum TaxID=45286 RepID=A0A125RDU9_9SACH|nr:HBL251Cp [Eremothecium sinecaudum]AMD18651.1 HBL251Cp [Eremothecium sinecaudum]
MKGESRRSSQDNTWDDSNDHLLPTNKSEENVKSATNSFISVDTSLREVRSHFNISPKPTLKVKTSNLEVPIANSNQRINSPLRGHTTGWEGRGDQSPRLTVSLKSYEVGNAQCSIDAQRSAKVISIIEDDEVDDFLGLQGEFINALEERHNSSWLPKLNSVKSKTDEESRKLTRPRPVDVSLSEINSNGKNASESQFENIELMVMSNSKANESMSSYRAESNASSSRDVKNDGGEDKMETVLVENSNENLGEQPPLVLYGKSLGVFSPSSRLRLRLAKMVMDCKFNLSLKVLLLAYTLLVSYRQFNSQTYQNLESYSNCTDLLIAFCNLLFTFEVIFKTIAFGFWDDSQLFAAHNREYKTVFQHLGLFQLSDYLQRKLNNDVLVRFFPKFATLYYEHASKQKMRTSKMFDNSAKSGFLIPRAFARNSWNRLNLVSTVAFWISFVLSLYDDDIHKSIPIFKTLAVFRVLRLADTDSGFSSVLKGIKYGLPQLGNVACMLLYFWVMFAILGVQSFQGSFRRRCVWTNPSDPTDTYRFEEQFCGGHIDPLTNKPAPYLYEDGTSADYYKGFICPRNSVCISGKNPHNGRISFDNLFDSMELITVIMSANTFTDLMYNIIDAENLVSSLFVLFSTFFLTIWMMNLLIAVLFSSFEIANEMKYRKEPNSRSMQNIAFRKLMQLFSAIKHKAQESIMPNWARNLNSFYAVIEWIFVLAIFVDLAVKSSVSVTTSHDAMEEVHLVELVVSCMLFFETIVRLAIYCTTPCKFLEKMNYVYDLIVAVISITISQPGVREGLRDSYYWLGFFQISRFYRVVLAFSITRNLWKRVLKNALMILNLSAFYFFLVFLVSLIVSTYFEGTVPTEMQDSDPFAMYSLPNTFLSLFIIGSTENWTDILYLLQAESPSLSFAFFGTCLLISWFFLANSMVLNIFIAVISQSLGVAEGDKRRLQIKHYLKHVYPERIQQFTNASLISRIKKKLFAERNDQDTRDFRQFIFRGTAILTIARNYEGLFEVNRPRGTYVGNFFKKNLPKLLNIKVVQHIKNNPFYRKPKAVFTEIKDHSEPNKRYSLELMEWEEEKLQFLRDHSTFNNSYFIFPHNNAIRKFCQTIVPPSYGKRTDGRVFFEDTTDRYRGNKYFFHIKRDTFVTITFIGTILMVLYSCYVTPIYRRDHEFHKLHWLSICEYSFVALFTLEFLIKTIADGFIYAPNAYILNPWNCIDLIVLVSMWIHCIYWINNSNSSSRVFKGLDALRALRFLTISSTARLTFKQVIFDGIMKIFGAALIALSLLYPFTVWGLWLFRGKLAVCNDGDQAREFCINEFSSTVGKWDVLMPRVYHNPILHFDNFASAFRSLYEIVSLEGWVDLLSDLVNSTGIGTPAESFASPWNAIFIVLFNFSSMVFILTLFISFIISNHARTTGSAFLTTEEKSWLEVKKLLSRIKPDATPKFESMGRFRRFCYRVAVEKEYFWYTVVLQFFFFIHILTLLLRRYRTPYDELETSTWIFMATTSVFLIHEFLFVTGKTFKLVVRDPGRLGRVLIVFFAFSFNVIQIILRIPIRGFTNVHSIFQLMIFLFIIPQNDILSELINTAVSSLPAILSLTYTWSILFLVYAIAMNQIFGLTRLNENTTGTLNFRTVSKSFIVLFRCSFGEGWNYIMHDLTVTKPYCATDNQGNYSDCGSKAYAYCLMMSWNILSMYIFLNMFISLIIENFSYVFHRGDKKAVARREEVRKFKRAWNKYDKDGTGEIEFAHLPALMYQFDGALSFKIWEGRLSVNNLVSNYIRKNPFDPYDVEVDLEGLNKELDTMDVVQTRQRILNYRRFIHEAQSTNRPYGRIKFSNLIKQIPLYTEYNPRECLGIDEYVKWLYTLNKVDKFLENEHNVDVLEMIVTRWKYLVHKRRKRQSVESFSETIDKNIASDINPPHTLSPFEFPDAEFTEVQNFVWPPEEFSESSSEQGDDDSSHR